MIKSLILLQVVLLVCKISWSQQKASVKEYNKTFTTYPFSDPDPIPEMTKIYPYFRFDGYTDKPIQKEWNPIYYAPLLPGAHSVRHSRASRRRRSSLRDA